MGCAASQPATALGARAASGGQTGEPAAAGAPPPVAVEVLTREQAMQQATARASAVARGAPPLLLASGLQFQATWDFYFKALNDQREAHKLQIDWPTELGVYHQARNLAVERAEDVEQLLRNGADVDDQTTGFTALYCAAALGHVDTTRILLHHHADVAFKHEYGDTALIGAASGGHTAVCEVLLAAGAQLEQREEHGNTALILAACDGHAAACEVLLAAGAQLEQRDKYDNTALILAACRGHTAVCEVLLAAGAQLEQRAKEGGTALIIAAGRGHAAVCKLLIQSGADLEAKGKERLTPLHCAASMGHEGCVEELLLAGAALNGRGGSASRTALVMAAEENHYGIAELCVAFGADVHAKDASNDTALDWALLNNNYAAADMLRRPATVAKRRPRPRQPPKRPPAPVFAPAPKPEKVKSEVHMAGSKPGRPRADAGLGASSQPVAAPTAPSFSPSMLAGYTAVAPAPLPRAPADLSIVFTELSMGELLGRGSFAKARSVHHAMWQHTEVAVKLFAIPVAPITASAAADPAAFSASVVAKMQQEAALIAGLRHPNVIALFGVCLSPPCIVMEHCGRGALYDVLGAARASPAAAAPLTWRWRLHVALDAALGMLHLHSRSPPVVHRDLKSPNLLLDAASRCKVADFNLSRILEEVGQRSGAASTVAVPTNPRWLAPEVLGGQRPSPPSDVYSFGVVLWELLTWELPYSGVVNPFAIQADILRGKRLALPPRAQLPGPGAAEFAGFDAYVSLMERCWAQEPEARPTFGQVAEALRALIQVLPPAEVQSHPAAAAAAAGSPAAAAAAASVTCAVCLEREPNAVLVHREAKLVHQCCCAECAALLQQRGQGCPVCRRPIDEVMLHFR